MKSTYMPAALKSENEICIVTINFARIYGFSLHKLAWILEKSLHKSSQILKKTDPEGLLW